ncbi:MAG: hypothetical protein INR73_19095 [Williamsia sp.]|nr:hypothetical protein [Williamsia sp.]
MKEIKIQEIINQFSRIQIDKADKYIVTYPVFIDFFRQTSAYTVEDLLTGIAFVYSWMPRILTIKSEALPKLSEYCNQFKNQYQAEIETPLFAQAVEALEGSIVATSKLLHFIFPDQFPIYDSHIYKYCWDKEKSYHYQVKNPLNYHSYREMCLKTTAGEEIHDLQKMVTDRLGYQVSKLRALEFSMFQIRKST